MDICEPVTVIYSSDIWFPPGDPDYHMTCHIRVFKINDYFLYNVVMDQLLLKQYHRAQNNYLEKV